MNSLIGQNFDSTIIEVKRQIAEIETYNVAIEEVKTMLKNAKDK